MTADARGQETAVRPGPAAGWSPVFALFMLAAVLVLPIFAHGCHGDADIDTEPGVQSGREGDGERGR